MRILYCQQQGVLQLPPTKILLYLYSRSVFLEQALSKIYENWDRDSIILSDSKSVLQVIEGSIHKHYKHNIKCNIKNLLHMLQKRRMNVTFMWVKRHVGITGNEIADKKAKASINSP